MLLYSVILVILYTGPSTGQKIPIESMYYSHKCSLEHKSAVTDAPLITGDMPSRVEESYCVLDSLFRDPTLPLHSLMSYAVVLDSRMNRDEMHELYKRIYTILDFDPYLAYAYLVNGNFHAHYGLIPYWVFSDLNDFSIRTPDDNVFEYFSLTSGIYHVRVLLVNEGTGFSDLAKENEQALICLRLEILEAYKGASLGRAAHPNSSDDKHPILKLSYAKEWTTTPLRYSGGDIVTNPPPSSAPFRKTQYGGFHDPQVGDEYFVFAQVYMEPRMDSIGIPYNVFPFYGYQPEGGLFKVNEGMVIDGQNFFGQGHRVPVDEFSKFLATYITKTFQ